MGPNDLPSKQARAIIPSFAGKHGHTAQSHTAIEQKTWNVTLALLTPGAQAFIHGSDLSLSSPEIITSYWSKLLSDWSS